MNPKKIKFNLDKVNYEECVPVQLQGRGVCKNCPHLDIKRGDQACSGQDILRTSHNKLGHKIPVTERKS